MKRLSFIGVLILLVAIALALPDSGLDIIEPSLSLTGVQGNQTNTGTFTINNTGSTNLTNVGISYTAEDFKDANNHQIILTFIPSSIPQIDVGSQQIVSVYATIPSNQFLGTYSGDVIASNGTVSDSFTLNVEVESEFVSIDITDIDPDDKVAPGDEISIDVRVDNLNSDLDLENIKIEVKIKDIDDGDDLEEKSDEFDIRSGDDNEETLTFTIPLNVDENTYDLIVIVDGEDEDGNNFEVTQIFPEEIEVEKDEDDEISVDRLTLDPETVSCGQLLEIEVKAVNTGQDNQRDMYLKVSARGLFDETSSSFDLEGDRGNFDDREITKTFTVTIPEDAEETTYLIDVQAYDEDDATIDTRQLDTTKVLTVSGDCEGAVTEPDAEIILDSTSVNVDTGDTITIDLSIKNNGDSTNEYEVEIEDYESFATLIGVDQPIQDIDEGETTEAVISLSIDDDASAGSYKVTINLKENGEVLDSKTLNIKVSEGAEGKIVPSVPITGFTSAIDKLFGAQNTASTVFFVLANLVLIAVIIFFIKLIFKK